MKQRSLFLMAQAMAFLGLIFFIPPTSARQDTGTESSQESSSSASFFQEDKKNKDDDDKKKNKDKKDDDDKNKKNKDKKDDGKDKKDKKDDGKDKKDKKDDGKDKKDKKDDGKDKKDKKDDGKDKKDKKDDGKDKKDKKDDGKDKKDKGKDVGALKHLEVKVKKETREALIHVPKAPGKNAHPVIFVFHGHGLNMKNAAESFHCHEEWPNAICVYMQGLPTPTRSDPQGRGRGWQNSPDELGNRDILFFDSTLEHLKKTYKVDDKRIFATGFSNGAGFTFILWGQRGEKLRAVAICAGNAGSDSKYLKPKPCMHIAGREDTQIDFAKQQTMMDFVRELNGCNKKGQPWGKNEKLDCTLFPSSKGTPFVRAIHPSGHMVPNQAGSLIVQFFKENSK